MGLLTNAKATPVRTCSVEVADNARDDMTNGS
jgi:hypothetical protein